MATIKIRAQYLAHEGGTKFYEVVEFHNHSKNRFLTVRRWGKVAQRYNGGEVKLEPWGSESQCARDAEDIINSKLKRGYDRAAADFGLHARVSCDSNELAEAMRHHYTNSELRAAILKLLEGEEGEEMILAEPDLDDVVEEKPEPPIVRGEEWGSW